MCWLLHHHCCSAGCSITTAAVLSAPSPMLYGLAAQSPLLQCFLLNHQWCMCWLLYHHCCSAGCSTTTGAVLSAPSPMLYVLAAPSALLQCWLLNHHCCRAGCTSPLLQCWLLNHHCCRAGCSHHCCRAGCSITTAAELAAPSPLLRAGCTPSLLQCWLFPHHYRSAGCSIIITAVLRNSQVTTLLKLLRFSFRCCSPEKYYIYIFKKYILNLFYKCNKIEDKNQLLVTICSHIYIFTRFPKPFDQNLFYFFCEICLFVTILFCGLVFVIL